LPGQRPLARAQFGRDLGRGRQLPPPHQPGQQTGLAPLGRGQGVGGAAGGQQRVGRPRVEAGPLGLLAEDESHWGVEQGAVEGDQGVVVGGDGGVEVGWVAGVGVAVAQSVGQVVGVVRSIQRPLRHEGDRPFRLFDSLIQDFQRLARRVSVIGTKRRAERASTHSLIGPV